MTSDPSLDRRRHKLKWQRDDVLKIIWFSLSDLCRQHEEDEQEEAASRTAATDAVSAGLLTSRPNG